MDLMHQGGFAFLVDIASAYPIIEKNFTNPEICDVHQMPLLDTQLVNIAVQKHSPFRDMFAIRFQHMAETGVMDRQIKWWHARKPECVKNDFETSPVNFKEFYPAHVIYGFGIFCSFLIFFCELMHGLLKYKINNVLKKETDKKLQNKKQDIKKHIDLMEETNWKKHNLNLTKDKLSFKFINIE